jgi:hypothetical protein
MVWRLARGLEKLRSQVNAKYPNRSRASDGTVGDRAHAARASDHNPFRGVVHALDLTDDPGKGFNAHALAERLRLSKDPRIKYIISNRRIASAKAGWAWRPYRGSNPHSKHIHVSINYAPHADSEKEWSI